MSGVEKNDNVALEERIERIRKNNERIQRRYLVSHNYVHACQILYFCMFTKIEL